MWRMFILATILMTGLAWAEPPPPPEGGINFFIEGACTDVETGEKGYCYAGMDNTGAFYTTFWQDDEMMFIHKTSAGMSNYEQVWTNPKYNSY